MAVSAILDLAQLAGTVPPPPRRPWTREDYDRATELGLFGPEERLELIGGEIIRKLPQQSGHATGVRRSEVELRRVFAAGHDVRSQLPLVLGSHSEPEPDVAVVTGSPRDYEKAHPTTAVLVVEIADSTLSFDRRFKGPLYASAGIPEYWIVNLRDNVLEVHREPEAEPSQPFGHRYGVSMRLVAADAVSPLHAPGESIAVADLLPAG